MISPRYTRYYLMMEMLQLDLIFLILKREFINVIIIFYFINFLDKVYKALELDIEIDNWYFLKMRILTSH